MPQEAIPRELIEPLFRANPDALFLSDPEGRILQVNEAACRLLHYSRAELCALTLAQIQPESEHQRVGEHVAAVRDGATSISDILLMTKEGQAIPAELNPRSLEIKGKPYLLGAVRDLRGRVQQESAAHSTQDLYRLVLDALNEVVVVIDPATGRFVDANRRATELYGFSLEQIRSMDPSTALRHVDTSARERGREIREKALAGEPQVFEWGLYDQQGNLIEMEISLRAATIRGERRLLAVARDIGPRKRLERLLNQSEYQLKEVAESMDEGLVIHGPTGEIVFANTAAGKILGVSREQLLGRTSMDPRWAAEHEDGTPWPGQDHPAMVSLTTGATFRKVVMGIRDPQTGLRWIALNSVPLFHNGGASPTGAMSTFLDITDEMEHKKELTESRKLYHRLFETSGTANAVFDSGCHLVVQNETSATQMSVAVGDVVGRTPLELFGEGRGERIEARLKEVLSKGEIVSELMSRPGPQGELWSESNYSPILDPDSGSVTGVLVTITDVTDRERLRNRTLQAQKLESLGVLAGGIAHDFNNLLAGLSTNLELIKLYLEKDHPDRALGKLSAAQAVLERSRALTRQILTFAKGGTGEKRTHELSGALEAWVGLARVGSEVAVRLTVEPDLASCFCDLDQIGQVIGGLMANAKDASPAGSEIVVSAFNVAGGVPRLAIRVEDQGTGIPPEIRERIFDPFFTTKPHGLGLGLATAHSIVAQHGGVLELTSTGTQGTVFTVTLPAALPQGESPQAVRTSAPLRPGRVLIMDDEPHIRTAIAEYLRFLGHRVVETADGQQTVQAVVEAQVAQDAFDWVILDLVIPGGQGGVETDRRLMDLGCRAPRVAISGYSSDGYSLPSTSGFRIRLAKPFTLDELQNALASCDARPPL